MPPMEIAEVRKDMQGLHAPEPTVLPQLHSTDASKAITNKVSVEKGSVSRSADAESLDSKEVLKHMVRLEFDVVQENEDPNAVNIFSFYGNYYDYLDEYNLIEVSISQCLNLSLAPTSQNA